MTKSEETPAPAAKHIDTTPGAWDAPHWMSPNVEGALWMLASALCFTVMTTLVKFLGANYPAPLQTFYRQTTALLVITPLLIRAGPGVFRATRPGILIIRAFGGTLAIILANYSYQLLPLAVSNALSFTRSLWMAPLALFLLRERVDAVRITVSLVGFAGVLMILGMDVTKPAAFWPVVSGVASAFLFAFTITGGKFVTRDHSVLTILAWGMTLGFLISIPPALFVWKWPTLPDFGLLILMGVSAAGTQSCFIKAIQRGDATAVGPVDYVRLVLALLIGYLMFNEVPTILMLFGALVVVGSALFLAWREHQVHVRATRG